MITVTELHEQNHKIGELAKILCYLFHDREMCDSNITYELFKSYVEKFDEHMKNNKQIYSIMLSKNEKSVRQMVERFMEGERTIKRVFKDYTDKWVKRGLHIGDHAAFVKETEEVFDLVWQRIQAESEQLYPMYGGYREGKR
ncbi:MAG: hypothetical protein HQL35_03175 [Alphaproteobacteria bacterium]|nr:hypothetical protein [Alphaproteobacteria bacterium]